MGLTVGLRLCKLTGRTDLLRSFIVNFNTLEYILDDFNER
jgi:hypothetical protein